MMRNVLWAAVVFGLLWLVILGGCEETSRSSVPSVTFDLSAAKPMKMSEFVDSITLIPLETNDSSLIKRIESLNITKGSLLVKDRGCLLVFDRNGKFLYSTEKLKGPGPENYRSGYAFTLLPNGNLEVYDVFACKLIVYDQDLAFVSSTKISKDVLPVSGYLYLSEDYRLFLGRDNLRLYSMKNNCMIDTIKVPYRKHFSALHMKGLQKKGDTILVSTKNQNTFYELHVDSLSMELKPVFEFDFGTEANFSLEDLPENEPEQFYRYYQLNNPRKAYVESKYVDDKRKMCFFVYDQKFYFAYYNENTAVASIYYNIWGEKGQLCMPRLYKDGMIYASCEAADISYFIDETLLSIEEKQKMESLREDDNPVIICYKLK